MNMKMISKAELMETVARQSPDGLKKRTYFFLGLVLARTLPFSEWGESDATGEAVRASGCSPPSIGRTSSFFFFSFVLVGAILRWGFAVASWASRRLRSWNMRKLKISHAWKRHTAVKMVSLDKGELKFPLEISRPWVSTLPNPNHTVSVVSEIVMSRTRRNSMAHNVKQGADSSVFSLKYKSLATWKVSSAM